MKQILVFIMFVTLLCWFMFAPVYKHVIITRQAVLQKEVDYLLEVGASGARGYIDPGMIGQSRQRLEERGFIGADLDYLVTTTTGVGGRNSGEPVPRGNGIRLMITYPYGGLFIIDRLVGIAPPSEGAVMAAVGMKMSEYVP
ncbi:hypothetical protein [Paenibacillus sp. J2TS4]|uniref:hypothetical protein n=1 Tax=Paenibacillus sp. J2TS4 TaxID=2807194 RepID=UPI001B0C5D1D|nr:hypothetical protein [Paenibacillus sp. J2TS4]GIP35440.1 hypothetical protein J2TS4_46500 [Paenibacillus sp. J2TS4]